MTGLVTRSIALLLISWGTVVCGLYAAASESNIQSVDGASPEIETGASALDEFVGPTGIDYVPPVYPRGKRSVGAEGWVQLNLMVASDGTPYEVAVSDSTGVPAFERAAIEAIESSRFQPARLNGEAIDAGMHVKVKFELEGGEPGARADFTSAYEELNEAIRKDDRNSAERQLDELAGLDVHNLYEDAYLNLGRYLYYSKWGTRVEQLAALKRAIAHEDRGGYLPPELFKSALLMSFKLQVAEQDFGGAMHTWGKLEEIGMDADQQAQGQRVIDQLMVLKDDQRAYKVDGTIGSNASWFYRLFKRSFVIDVIDGELAELKLRCDKSYSFSRYDASLRYQISPEDGNCHIEIVGNPGTTFTLTQS